MNCFKLLFPFLAVLASCASEPALTYISGQQPGKSAEVFAPGFISKDSVSEFGIAFSADGTECFYGVSEATGNSIWYTSLKDGAWSDPVETLAYPDYHTNDPFLTKDETRLYYISDRPVSGDDSTKDYNIWYSTRNGSTWEDAVCLGEQINTDRQEFFVSFTDNGNLYFASHRDKDPDRWFDLDLYHAKPDGSGFQTAEKLPGNVNTAFYEADMFVSPDESYIIFAAAKKDGYGQGDLYMSFRDAQGNWCEAMDMGPGINAETHELCPFVSRDGKRFFYTSNEDIYWTSTHIIDSLQNVWLAGQP